MSFTIKEEVLTYMNLPPVNKMIDYLKLQPPETWCAWTKTDEVGRRCVLGHVDKMLGVDGAIYNRGDINPVELAAVNNGTKNYEGIYDYDGLQTEPDDGESIKARVLQYLEAHVQS